MDDRELARRGELFRRTLREFLPQEYDVRGRRPLLQPSEAWVVPESITVVDVNTNASTGLSKDEAEKLTDKEIVRLAQTRALSLVTDITDLFDETLEKLKTAWEEAG